jgi:hypothetical protein
MNDGSCLYLPPGPRASVGRSAEATATAKAVHNDADALPGRSSDAQPLGRKPVFEDTQLTTGEIVRTRVR